MSIALNEFSPALASLYCLWNQLPIPLTVDSAITEPPVEIIGNAAAQIVSIFSMNAASSKISNEPATERPDCLEEDLDLISDPLLNLSACA